MMKVPLFRLTLLLLMSAVALATVTGCDKKSETTIGTTAKNNTAASSGTASTKSDLTRSDMNPAMSDKQKDAILRRKNRE